MKVVLFAGPTIDRASILRRLQAEVHPPASFGDVYRAAKGGAATIGIIDGYFDRVAAVWHKEILWAMSEGVHVFGAASMGALRAAELADLGMIGVGAIFRAFQTGELEDDDEVAVAHGDASVAYASVSDAMVNIRATLRLAVEQGVLRSEAACLLESMTKGRFYAERSFKGLLRDTTAAGLSEAEAQRFREFLESSRYDAKRADAELLLEELARHIASGSGPKRVSYRFNATDAWHQAMRLADRQRARDHATAEPKRPLPPIDDSPAFAGIWSGAVARGAAFELAMTAGVHPDAAALRNAAEDLCRRHGLLGTEDLQRWCEEQGLDEVGTRRFLEAQARLAWAEPLIRDLGSRHLLDHLRAVGRYQELGPRLDSCAHDERDLALLGRPPGTSRPT